jgi:PAS domain S-box-containing protein
LWWGVWLTLMLALGQALPAARFFASPAHYLPLHTTLEVVAIAVSAMVFALAWNLRGQADNDRRLILGTAFLAVCLIDLAHTLSYAGMPDLVTPSSPEKAINFWLAARYVAATALLAVALMPKARAAPGVSLGLALVLAASAWWLGLWHADWLPRTFVDGQGLTAFKVGAEYLLAALYAAAAVVLFLKGRESASNELQWLAAAAWVQGLAEMYFTLYADVTDVFNLLGHVYKAVAYLMVYRALFVAGVQQPYRELAFERSRLQALVATIPDPVWLKDLRGVYLGCNTAFERMYGAKEADIVGKTDHEFVDRDLADFFSRHDRAAMAAGGPTRNEEWLNFVVDGYRGLFETTKTPMYAAGRLIGVLGVAHDITRQRAMQHELQQRIKELNCLYSVATLTEDMVAPLAPQLQAVADRLPAAWQYPERACARLTIGGASYTSPGFAPTPLAQVAAIPLRGDTLAAVAVFYRPGDDDGPAFLAEEQQLLDAVAARLAGVVAQRETQRALHDREAVFMAIANQAEDSIALIDFQHGRFVEFNEAAARNLGYSAREFAGMGMADIEARLDPAALKRDFENLAASGSLAVESRHRHKDGSTRDALVRLRTLEFGGQPYVAAIWSDISDRKRTERLLRESEQHFRNLANGASALIWTSGLDRRNSYFNEPWLRFTGRALAQESGDGWLQGVHPEDRERCVRTFAEAFDGRQPFSMEYRLRRCDGVYRWLRDDGNPRFDSQGGFLGYIGFCVDITGQKEAAAELERYQHQLEALVTERTRELALAKEAAEAASVAKSYFLANMSHEIRTPLNAIVGMAHLIRRAGVSPPQAERLKKIDAAGEHLLETISTILDLSKIEAGKFVLEETELSVGAIVAHVASMLSERARAKQLALVTQTQSVPRHLAGDPTRLRQALVNYVGNAIKFTQTGHVTLSLAVAQEDADSVLLRFEVQDTGVGIAPDVLPRLFTAFEQADNSITREFGGTGLGLALTRRLAQLMGGDAGATSMPGQGSTFWFTARLRRCAPSGAAAQLAMPNTAESALKLRHRGRCILLAEDEPVNREVISYLLRDAALTVDCVEDGAQAVAQAGRQPYDLILMDMQMPHMDGLTATRRLRAVPAYAAVPILAFTANAFAEDRALCLEAGMNDFIAKPVNPQDLFVTVLKWLERRAP